MGPCQRSDTLNGFVTDQPSRASCRNPASPRLWDDLPQVQSKPRGMPSPGSSLIFQLWDAATVEFMHAKRRERTLRSLSSSPTHFLQISPRKKKVLGRASDFFFFLSAEKSLQLGLCARPLANTNAHQKDSECEVSFVEVLFTSTSPLHKVIWFAWVEAFEGDAVWPCRGGGGILRDETSLRRNEDGRGWIFKKKSLRNSYVLYFHKFKNEGGEEKKQKKPKISLLHIQLLSRSRQRRK